MFGREIAERVGRAGGATASPSPHGAAAAAGGGLQAAAHGRSRGRTPDAAVGREETRERGSSSPTRGHGAVSGRKDAVDRPGRGAEKAERRPAAARGPLRRPTGRRRGAGQGPVRDQRR